MPLLTSKPPSAVRMEIVTVVSASFVTMNLPLDLSAAVIVTPR